MADEFPEAFPAGFVWGAATSAYQIEGSPLADGAGASNWHRFSHTPGRTHDGETGDVACDHYRRAPDDVALMSELGLGAYRFSLAWGRILPEGRGRLNQVGLDFYSRLVDLLLERGIQPFVTLYHWDLPAALDERGGWLNPDIAGWFADYARIAFEALGDRVAAWATLNEPWVSVDAGYMHGTHAPGHNSLFEAARAAHQLLRAHGAAIEVGRAVGVRPLGIVINLELKDPASNRPLDVAAARRADAYMNRQFMDPLFFGRYPDELPAIYGEAWPEHRPSDFESIRAPLDFVGINYYTRGVTRHDAQSWPLRASRAKVRGARYTATGWEVYPEGLLRTLLWVKERYGDVPLYVTENGAAFPDRAPGRNGRVEDPLRVRYYRDHLRAAREAIRRGVDLRGYFAWSLLDNYEWSAGFSKRFGIVRVDYRTQRRTLKASGEYYRRIVASNGAELGEERSRPATTRAGRARSRARSRRKRA